MKRLIIFGLAILIAFTFYACNDQTSERTSSMSTSNQTSETTTANNTENTTSSVTQTSSTSGEITLSFSEVSMVNESAFKGDLIEFDILEDGSKEPLTDSYNPYDYNQIKLLFTFTSPNNSQIKQTAFWYKGYETVNLIGGSLNEEGYYESGQEYIDWGDDNFSRYRVRIKPEEVGDWNYRLEVFLEDNLIQTLNGGFSVLDSELDNKGYIQVDQVNKRNFIFSESAETFIPMGSNFAWFSTTKGTYDYYNWFKELNENNANFARIWLSNWSFSLHKFSYTNFDTRQNILARLDMLFEFASEFDAYIMLTLINHGQFSFNTNPEWAENPYNNDNGGMLEYPIQFFYDAEAKMHYKNELMYLISRYGHSENLFAWELFNEVDWVDGYSHIVVTRWHDEMAQFIKENDPYKHLITTSYKYPFGTPAFDLESIDFASFHSYDYYDKFYYDKLSDELSSLFNKYQKPVFYGEIGIDWQSGNNTYNADYTGITLHQGLWGGMLSSGASANQWWWDSWIDRYDLWDRFRGASTYALEIDVANKAYSLLQENDSLTITGDNIKILGYLLEDTAYGYLYNKNWNYWNRDVSVIENISVEIPFNNGEYQLIVYDTVTGEIISDTQITVNSSMLEITGLSFATDYAFIVR